MSSVAIIGLGNPHRADDGVGWVVIDALEKEVTEGVFLHRVKGDLAALIDLLARYAVVFVVDACLFEETKGEWERIDLLKEPLKVANKPTSTHGFSLKEAIDLGSVIGHIPSKLILYAISGKNFSIGGALSKEMEIQAQLVVKQLMNEPEIQACTKATS